MDKVYLTVLLLALFSYVWTEPRLHVSPSDVSMAVHEHKNISIFLTHPINETIYINFEYQISGIIDELPANRSIKALSAEHLGYEIIPKKASKVAIKVESNEGINTSNAFIRLKISNIPALNIVSTVIGWLYFVAWSVSFYPQVVLNFQRKSVIGLDFNFLVLNIVGFFCYSVFNIALFTSPIIKKQYTESHPYDVNPVHINDVVFAVHACLISLFTGLQCLIYERGDQKVSLITKIILGCIFLFLGISLIVSVTNIMTYLLYMEFFSYVKLFITIIKYVPQAVFNFVRKSTVGWSIGNVLLDFTGGSLSMLQMFLDAYNYDSWGILFTDLTKFGLGLFSVLFDILFIVQHYCLYNEKRKKGYDDMETSKTTDSSNEKTSSEPELISTSKIHLVS